MAQKIELLQLSPTMEEGTIVKWLKKEGEKVSAGDALAEIETDKAVMEQEAFDDGTMLKIVAEEGSAVKVGSLIAVVGEKGEDVSSLMNGGGASSAPAAKDEGAVEKPTGTPKVNFKPEPPSGDEATASLKTMEASRGEGGRVLASPLARKMAEDAGLNLSDMTGSGPHGRIVKRDVESAIESGGAAAPVAEGAPQAAALTVGPQEGDEEVPLSGMRKTIARRLVQSRQDVPSFTLTVEVDAEPLQKGVARVREAYPEEKVTVTHFIIKAMASTVMRHEWLRTQWVDGKMVRRNHGSISCAVAIEDGLLTPVIRNAHGKGVVQIARELRELAGLARERKLGEQDLTGGVQTLSNLGMYGIDQFDAIINPPEASILAVGAVAEKPVVKNGELVAGKVFNISLSCDHRVVDGAVGAAYLKDLKTALEDPLLILV